MKLKVYCLSKINVLNGNLNQNESDLTGIISNKEQKAVASLEEIHFSVKIRKTQIIGSTLTSC